MTRKRNPTTGLKKIDPSTSYSGALLALTAGSVVLMEQWGWPEEWVQEWTRITVGVMILISGGQPPTKERMEALVKMSQESPEQFEEYLKQNKELATLVSHGKPTESPVD